MLLCFEPALITPYHSCVALFHQTLHSHRSSSDWNTEHPAVQSSVMCVFDVARAKRSLVKKPCKLKGLASKLKSIRKSSPGTEGNSTAIIEGAKKELNAEVYYLL